MKPMLASDYVEAKLKFPLIAEPKIDGVRALNMTGKLTGRSLKPFKNKHTTAFFSHSALTGLDGEMAAWHECDPALCRKTSSALGTILGEPWIMWWLFDYVTPETKDMPYHWRVAEALPKRFEELRHEVPHIFPHLRMIPFEVVVSMEQLLAYDDRCLELGYEGTILRSSKGKHKQGRSTPTEGGLLRIKRFVEFEFQAHTIIEGEANENEAQVNELGQTFRSSHQENKVANGMVGAILGTVLADVKDGDNLLFAKGSEVRVGAGCLTHDQRRHYFQDQAEFLALIHKAKFFPKGIKDKPRFPTWQSVRQEEDM